MSKSIQALREQKAALAKEARNKIENMGDRIWSPEDKTAFDTLTDQMEAIDKQIDSMQRFIDQEAESRFENLPMIDPKNKAAMQGREAMVKMLRYGEKALTNEEIVSIRNTMSTTTGSEGGYTVESTIAKELIDMLKDYRGMRDVASQITTEKGEPLSYSTSDGTAEEGEWIAENASATDDDVTFGTVPLSVSKCSSKVFTLPIELIQDSSVDVIALINQRARDRIGRTQNKGFTIGSGTGEPMGLVTAASVGRVGAAGQVADVIYDDLVELVDSVDIAYDNGGLKFMFSQAMRKVIRKIKDADGRPIWMPNYDAGIAGGFADQLLGYDVQINNAMPTPAASAKSIAFGELKKYMIRDAMMLTLFRFGDSPYTKKGQVGFLAWARAGGNLLDTGAVKLYQHPAA